MSALLHTVVTVYIDAGIFLYEAFQHTTLQRHQPLSQRKLQLTGTAYPQTSTAKVGESRVDTRDTRTLPRHSYSAKPSGSRAARDSVSPNGPFCWADDAQTSTRCWTFT